MSAAPPLALFGATPLFDRPIANGQRFFPDWTQYEAMFQDIFKRQYYTNDGPLTQQLERRLAERLGVRHAMCVTNEFIGLVSAAQALGVRGQVVVPAHSGVAQIIECGPGRVLTGLNRRIERREGLEYLALEDPASIDAALAATREGSHA